jgi:UDP-N-acetylglucosamine--N-acetylmuramyl-(pentapeptide) pyrophosphoryl-undecaprenol N-acetylglucosamine transferase
VQSFESFPYPQKLDKTRKTILICGGSQGAQSMNDGLIDAVVQWSMQKLQIIWQTGTASYKALSTRFVADKNIFIFETLDDLYPFYAVSKIIIGRAGASTLAEIAYFGLPCVLIPLPWASENHQWVNAGLVQMQGWGIRIKQDASTGKNIIAAVSAILSDDHKYNAMCMKALDNSPAEAADKIVSAIRKDLKL